VGRGLGPLRGAGVCWPGGSRVLGGVLCAVRSLPVMRRRMRGAVVPVWSACGGQLEAAAVRRDWSRACPVTRMASALGVGGRTAGLLGLAALVVSFGTWVLAPVPCSLCSVGVPGPCRGVCGLAVAGCALVAWAGLPVLYHARLSRLFCSIVCVRLGGWRGWGSGCVRFRGVCPVWTLLGGEGPCDGCQCCGGWGWVLRARLGSLSGGWAGAGLRL